MDKQSVTVIYKLCYQTLHFLYIFYNFMLNIKCKLLELCHEFYNKQKPLPKFEKLPNHLTILLGNENPSYNDLANLILWCLAAQITFVSFYDFRGNLYKNQAKLQEFVAKKKTPQDRIIWHNENSDCKNGYTGPKIHIKVLPQNGRKDLVDLCRQLALNNSTNLITINSFDYQLRKTFEFPDPDLGLCCGKTFCLFGYPPWQIRVTEFFSIHTHHHLQFDTFLKLLYSYSKCEQRYGK